VTIDSKYARSVYYIGSDRALHQISNINFTWRSMPDQDRKLWPLADSANASLAATFHFDTSEGWIYYVANGTIQEIRYGSDGLFRAAQSLPTEGPRVPAIEPAPTTDDGAAGNGLTTGAKAGIGVGVGVGILALAGTVGMILFLRRRAASDRAAGDTHEGMHLRDDTPAYPGYDEYRPNPSGPSTPGTQNMAQPYTEFGNLYWGNDAKPATEVVEAGGNPAPQELEEPQMVHELPQANQSHEMIGEGHYREMRG
jgi:hypothetical protein